jgi:nickel transport protein
MKKYSGMFRMILLLAVALLVSLGPAVSAQAHRVKVFAYGDGETIFTESSFSKSSPAQGAAISVQDEGGTVVFEGVTDEQGKCDFAVPRTAHGTLTITVDAGEGHRNEWKLSEAEYR